MCCLRRIVIVVGLVSAAASNAAGIAPPFLTDAELAKFPVIVVAQWEKAPFISNKSKEYVEGVDGNEWYTRLNILEVIRGDLKPGEVELKMGYGIDWNTDGKKLMTYMSTNLPGDVEDVTKPAIWFLKRERSWDEARKTEYLSIRNYRAVQPIELKNFYLAMIREDADQIVPKMLSMENTLVTQRVLRHLCGGIRPWPFDQGSHGMFYREPRERGKVYHEEAGRVWEFVAANSGKPRPISAAAYAELAGKECVSNMRLLLDDGDAMVRGVAIGVLARLRDQESIDRFAKAARGLQDAWESCRVLEELAGWDDPRLIPAFISFLQNDSFAYQEGEKFGIPVLLAQEALLARTGHAFPLDADLAGKAWEEASKIADKGERLRLLQRIAPQGKAPIIATLVAWADAESSKAEQDEETQRQIEKLNENEIVLMIRLANYSSQPVTILKYPSLITETTEEGDKELGTQEAAVGGVRELVTIKPRDFARLYLRVPKIFLATKEEERRISLSYLGEEGVKAWSGEIGVVFRASWRNR